MDKVKQLIEGNYKGKTAEDVLDWLVANQPLVARDLVRMSILGGSYDYQTVLEWAAQQLIDEVDG